MALGQLGNAGLSPIGFEPIAQRPGFANYNYADGTVRMGPLLPQLTQGLRAPSVEAPAPPEVASAPAPASTPSIQIPKAPKGMVVSGMTVQPGVDNSQSVAADKQQTEQLATTQEQVGASEAEAYRNVMAARERGLHEAVGKRAADAELAGAQEEAAKAEVAKLRTQKDEPIDPRAAFKEMGVATAMGAVLAAGLVGALNAIANAKSAAAGQGQPFQQNGVVDAIVSKVNDSIAQQRQDRAEKRADRANWIGYYEREYRDEKAIRLAAEADTLELSARYYEAVAEQKRGTVYEQQAKALAEQTRLASTARIAELQKDSATRVAVALSRAPTTGPKTLAQQLAEQEAAQKIRQGKLSAAKELGMSDEEANAFVDKQFPSLALVGRGATTEQRDQANQQAFTAAENEKKAKAEKESKPNEKQQMAQAANVALNGFGTDVGLTRGKDGKWTAGDGIVTEATKRMVAENYTKNVPGAVTPIANRRKILAEMFGRLQSGGVIGPDEEVRFNDMIGAGTGAQLADQLNALEETLLPRLSTQAEAQAQEARVIPSTWK